MPIPKDRNHSPFEVEAEKLLAAGAVSHNHMYFRMFAIEACFDVGDHDEAQRHARALADFCAEDGLFLIEFLADRGGALARVGLGEQNLELAGEIDRLIVAGDRMHQKIWVAALREARDQLARTAEG